ncbi:MAG TPA: flagellar basal body protein FliL [Thermodesulfobacteriaceae bacterium]|nr:flagellar basal body protein FliL [Thermodesulfobacteriaceae bacterium]
MAKEKKNKDKENGSEEQQKKKKPLLLFIILGLLLLAGGGAGAYFFLFTAPSDEELAREIAKEQADSGTARPSTKIEPGVMMQLEPFIVNLADPRVRHFLKTTITLELVDDNAKEDAGKLLPKIRDDIIMLLSNQTMEDIITMEGKIRLKDQIMARVGRILGNDRIQNMYFAQFVVQ